MRAAAGAWLAGTLALGAWAVAPATAGAGPLPPSLPALVVAGVGPGYVVTAQGPPDVARFAHGWPNPTAMASALAGAGDAQAYARTWQDAAGANVVQVLVMRFPAGRAGEAFESAADRSLASSAVVSSGPLRALRGARTATYVTTAGYGEAVVLSVGNDVALLSFVSAPSKRTAPITAAEAQRVATAQHAALENALRGPTQPVHTSGPSAAELAWAALAVMVLAAGLVTPLVLHRGRDRRPVAPKAPEP